LVSECKVEHKKKTTEVYFRSLWNRTTCYNKLQSITTFHTTCTTFLIALSLYLFIPKRVMGQVPDSLSKSSMSHVPVTWGIFLGGALTQCSIRGSGGISLGGRCSLGGALTQCSIRWCRASVVCWGTEGSAPPRNSRSIMLIRFQKKETNKTQIFTIIFMLRFVLD